jgi:hypothetical protein
MTDDGELYERLLPKWMALYGKQQAEGYKFFSKFWNRLGSDNPKDNRGWALQESLSQLGILSHHPMDGAEEYEEIIAAEQAYVAIQEG